MRIGVPKETAEDERRVALVPEVVRKLAGGGHEVVVEAGAGEKALLPDSLYTDGAPRSGIRMTPTSSSESRCRPRTRSRGSPAARS